jgi:hypothetical protein
MYTLNRMGQKQMKCKKRSNKVVQNNVIKGSPQGSFIVLNTDYKMFFRLFVSEENESPLKCIDSYRNFWMFLSFPKLHPFRGPMNIIENPHRIICYCG